MGIILERLRQKHRTMSYPNGPAPDLPERWRGFPVLSPSSGSFSPDEVSRCPTGALSSAGGVASIDVGRCLFCGGCEGLVSFSREYSMGRFSRRDLVVGGEREAGPSVPDRLLEIRSLFGKSLKLREISAGGCNACEADCNVLSTLAWDVSRFGISFVASPRHADGILVTGPVTDNMRLAVEKTYAAVPTPKVVIAVGACAVSGGLYGDDGVGVLESMFPVDMYIPGCPPHPLVILEGLLRLMGRVPDIGLGSEAG